MRKTKKEASKKSKRERNPVPRTQIDETSARDIARRMVGGTGQTDIAAGFTYIGQMVCHDIVPSTNPTATRRHVTGVLSLDSFYGNAPGEACARTDVGTAYLDGSGRFDVDSRGGDLPRLNGKASIPEPRNDENAIIAQLHLLWMRLHNLLIDDGYAANADEAREQVTLLFQLVVIEDFLKSCLAPRVFAAIFERMGFFSRSPRLPEDFFSMASFRFGHSIVRESYMLQHASQPVSLAELLHAGPIGEHLRVEDWSLLFGSNIIGKPLQPMLPMDTFITGGMGKMPGTGREEARQIAFLNIMAGQKVGLPSGLQMFDEIDKRYPGLLDRARDRLREEHLEKASFHGADDLDIDGLPLWLYILLEAQVSSGGARLGPLGSALNALVLRRSIAAAPISVIDGKNYSPYSALTRVGRFADELEDIAWRDHNPQGGTLMMALVRRLAR